MVGGSREVGVLIRRANIQNLIYYFEFKQASKVALILLNNVDF
jgi:hypothetical protein